MRNTCRVLMVLAALVTGWVLISAQAVSAQSAPDPNSNRRPPSATGSTEPGTPSSARTAGAPEPGTAKVSEPGLRFLSSEMSVIGKVVKHAPYSAEIVTESTQTLGSGAKLTRRTTGMIYRDSEGRTRRELSATIAGPFVTSGDSQRLIFISDPVAGISSTFNPDRDTVRTKPFSADGNESLTEPEIPAENSRVESLRKEVIEGFVAEGTRTTIVIPVGRIGNDQPLEIVHERWYSPELQIVLLSKHQDPRWGETVYKLINISPGAPDPSLFTIPKRPTASSNKSRPRQEN